MHAGHFCSASGGESIVPSLERGLGYLASGSAEAASTFIRKLSGGRYLWLTQRPMEPQPEGGEMIRVTTLSGTGRTIDPKRLVDLHAAAAAFLEQAEPGLVVLDCLEYLVLHNGPERVARALADVHDEVSVHGGTLVIFVESNAANPRLVAWLAREFDPLPATTSAPLAAADALSA